MSLPEKASRRMRMQMQIINEIKASYAFVERNLNLVKRYLSWEIVFLFYNVINTLTIGLIAYNMPPEERAATTLYLIIGALLWGFLSVIFMEISNSVSMERWEGTIEYTFMAPIRRLTYLGGTCIYAIIYGAIRTIVVLTAVILFFDLTMENANIAGAFLILIISSFAFMGLGLIAAILPLLSPEKGSQATNIIAGFLLLVSGIYYPVEALPVWLNWVSRISPATYTLRAIRRCLIEGATVRDVLPDVWMILIIGVLLIPLGFYIFELAENYAMKNGKLKRNG